MISYGTWLNTKIRSLRETTKIDLFDEECLLFYWGSPEDGSVNIVPKVTKVNFSVNEIKKVKII